MSFLLDTNVVSEWVKPRPDEGVAAWIASVDEEQVFLSVVTLAELRYGIQLLAPGRRQEQLDTWLRDEVPARFEGRLLGIDNHVADAWGHLVARSRAAGQRIGVMDGLLAASAFVANLTLVTRNVCRFPFDWHRYPQSVDRLVPGPVRHPERSVNSRFS